MKKYAEVYVCQHCGDDDLSQADDGKSHCWTCEQDGYKVLATLDLNAEIQPRITKSKEV
jgi:hypothetical protein